MIPNKQLELLQAWKENLFSELSISEIMKKSDKQTKTWVFNTLKLLTKSQLLLFHRKGNINLYNLNFNNPLLIQILQYLEAQNSLSFSKLDIIMQIINTIPVKNYCLLVFGSYVQKRHKSSSDLDICLLVENKQIKKKIKPYFKDVKFSHAIEIDEHYITFDDFIKMLLRDEDNIAKQIFQKHKIFYNADIYYQLIKQAYKHGFRVTLF